MSRSVWMKIALSMVVGTCLMSSQANAQPPVVPAVIVSPTYLAPPPPRQEAIVAAPSPQMVWVAGHWDRTPDSWNWVSGTWVKPPFLNAFWRPGYWQHQNGKFAWERGHWAAATQGVVVNKPIDLPPLYSEPQPPAPTSNTTLTWQPGYWQWQGTWIWVPGTYIESTVPKATWAAGQWTNTPDGAWAWTPAHWATQ